MNQHEISLSEFFKPDNDNSVDVDTNSIFLFDEINNSIAKEIWSKIHLLDDQRSKEPIRVYINSQGGDVDSMNSIVACLDNVTAEVHVYITGIAASAAAIIALVGTKVFISKYASIMFHAFSISMEGQKQQDAMVYSKHTAEVHERAMKILLKKKNINHKVFIKNYEKQDWYISPEEAVKLKIADGIF